MVMRLLHLVLQRRQGSVRDNTLTALCNAKCYDTDKKDSGYLRNYEEIFRPIRGKEVKLLELGIGKGGALLLWRDYFEKAVIAGLDMNPVHIYDTTGRIHIYH